MVGILRQEFRRPGFLLEYVDWYALDQVSCNETTCSITILLESGNVFMDVYKNGLKVGVAVKVYQHFDEPYTGPFPVYMLRVYSVSREPYKLTYA